MPSPLASRSESAIVNCRINAAEPNTRPIQVTVVFTKPSSALLPTADKTVNRDKEQVEDHNKNHEDTNADRNTEVTLGRMAGDDEGRIEDRVRVFARDQGRRRRSRPQAPTWPARHANEGCRAG